VFTLTPLLVILAAGGSSRMGQPKALLRRGDRTLLELHLAPALALGWEGRVVVGASEDALRAALPGLNCWVSNPHWASGGPLDSLRLALEGEGPGRVVVVSPVDCPPASAAELQALVRLPLPALRACGGQPGHPLALRVEQARGLRHRLDEATVGASQLESGDPGALLNLNRWEDWARWCALSGKAGADG
jgi:CTP:molybdopterin cytidylyltransferase MocA